MKSVMGSGVLLRINVLILGSVLTALWINPAYAKHKPEEEEEAKRVEAEENKAEPVPLMPEFVSPLSKFKKYQEVDKPDWINSNKRVGEIGGWRVYAMEAFEAENTEETEKSDDDDESSDNKGDTQ